MMIRILLASTALVFAGVATPRPSYAVGCISGGLAGAAAGHMVHHGVLGAIGGCIAGHEYHKHSQQGANRTQSDQDYSSGSGTQERGGSTYQ
ncbi:MAG: hypothetical protein ACJ8AW_21885 [Rhodopila sp.]